MIKKIIATLLAPEKKKFAKSENQPFDTVVFGCYSAALWVNCYDSGEKYYRWSLSRLSKQDGSNRLGKSFVAEDLLDSTGLNHKLMLWYAADERTPEELRAKLLLHASLLEDVLRQLVVSRTHGPVAGFNSQASH